MGGVFFVEVDLDCIGDAPWFRQDVTLETPAAKHRAAGVPKVEGHGDLSRHGEVLEALGEGRMKQGRNTDTQIFLLEDARHQRFPFEVVRPARHELGQCQRDGLLQACVGGGFGAVFVCALDVVGARASFLRICADWWRQRLRACCKDSVVEANRVGIGLMGLATCHFLHANRTTVVAARRSLGQSSAATTEFC